MSSAKKRKIVDKEGYFKKNGLTFFLYRGNRKTVLFKVQKVASSCEKKKFKASLRDQPSCA